jgi:hypothetical protein
MDEHTNMIRIKTLINRNLKPCYHRYASSVLPYWSFLFIFPSKFSYVTNDLFVIYGCTDLLNPLNVFFCQENAGELRIFVLKKWTQKLFYNVSLPDRTHTGSYIAWCKQKQRGEGLSRIGYCRIPAPELWSKATPRPPSTELQQVPRARRPSKCCPPIHLGFSAAHCRRSACSVPSRLPTSLASQRSRAPSA